MLRTIFQSKTINALSAWLAVLSAVGWVVQQMIPQWFGTLTLPQQMLVAFGAALGLTLTLAIILALVGYGFRKFRPMPMPEPPSEQPPPYDDTELREKVESSTEILAALSQDAQKLNSRLAELEGIKKAIIDDYQRMLGLEARFTGELDGLKGAMRDEGESLRQYQQVLEGKLADLRRELESSVKKTLSSLHAIYLREELRRLAEEIVLDAADLSERLQAGEVYDDAKWQQWENVHGHWEAGLKCWIQYGQWYAKDVESGIYTVEEHRYAAPWNVQDSQFPHSEAVRRFKRFRIIHRQWEQMREKVERGVFQVAFVGLTEEEVRYQPNQNP